jgi:hypothetical protein
VFLVEAISVENASRVLVKVETEAERILGSFGLKEHDAHITVKLPNGDRLYHVFEQMGLTYASRPLPEMEASQAMREKWKAEVSWKPAVKRVKTSLNWASPSKTAPPRMTNIVNVMWVKAKPEPQVVSEIELALAKPVGVSKNFWLLDVPAPSRGHHPKGRSVTHAAERVVCVVAFDNRGEDSSPDVRQTPSPKKAEAKRLATPLTSG